MVTRSMQSAEVPGSPGPPEDELSPPDEALELLDEGPAPPADALEPLDEAPEPPAGALELLDEAPAPPADALEPLDEEPPELEPVVASPQAGRAAISAARESARRDMVRVNRTRCCIGPRASAMIGPRSAARAMT
ncbi:hypothetical protein SCE1572_34515 [Sorangium cellulosum So0157-2]|uniref:Uncharacterized protein n=1 Tax=Sorangium cellulosum So0157-2 TaxID=1254432 RepID=S4Y2X3_SORCE|nr:hypothetical protein SCE1572_34515 [Sorangium cellulosum So0157-2]